MRLIMRIKTMRLKRINEGWEGIFFLDEHFHVAFYAFSRQPPVAEQKIYRPTTVAEFRHP